MLVVRGRTTIGHKECVRLLEDIGHLAQLVGDEAIVWRAHGHLLLSRPFRSCVEMDHDGQRRSIDLGGSGQSNVLHWLCAYNALPVSRARRSPGPSQALINKQGKRNA